MSARYFLDTGIGQSLSHRWGPSFHYAGYFWVSGIGPFTHNGFAVVDDFGDLVEVPWP